MAKLDVRACGIALGIVSAALMLILGTVNILFYWAETWRRVVPIMYLMYRPSLAGVVLSAVWSFIYTFAFGACFALLYNRVVEENKTEFNEKVKKLAHQIWEKKGRPIGTSAEDWKEAERIVKGG